MPQSPRARWTAVFVAATLVVAGGASVATGLGSSVDLPPVEPDQLLASALNAVADPGPVSGEVVVRLDLGLPQIVEPEVGPAASGPLSTLFGDHDLKVWRSDDGLRVADLVELGERALFVSRTEAWFWDFESFTAYRLGPRVAGGPVLGGPVAPIGMLDPLTAARGFLRSVDGTTAVSVGPGRRVAGRAAYPLVLEPRTSETLVERVELAIDAERRLPLSLGIFSRRGGGPSVLVEFTSVSFGPIAAGVFDFAPPAGATVQETGHDHGLSRPPPTPPGSEGVIPVPGRASNGDRPLEGLFDTFPPEIRAFGSGWATVVAVRIGSSTPGALGIDVTEYRPVAGPLFSIDLVERSGHAWLVYGAVPASALAEVAPELP